MILLLNRIKAGTQHKGRRCQSKCQGLRYSCSSHMNIHHLTELNAIKCRSASFPVLLLLMGTDIFYLLKAALFAIRIMLNVIFSIGLLFSYKPAGLCAGYSSGLKCTYAKPTGDSLLELAVIGVAVRSPGNNAIRAYQYGAYG